MSSSRPERSPPGLRGNLASGSVPRTIFLYALDVGLTLLDVVVLGVVIYIFLVALGIPDGLEKALIWGLLFKVLFDARRGKRREAANVEKRRERARANFLATMRDVQRRRMVL